MRQLHALLRAIHIRKTTKEYTRMKFHAQLAHAEMCSLDELLGVSSEEEDSSAFDDETDKKFMELAKENLAKSKKNV